MVIISKLRLLVPTFSSVALSLVDSNIVIVMVFVNHKAEPFGTFSFVLPSFSYHGMASAIVTMATIMEADSFSLFLVCFYILADYILVTIVKEDSFLVSIGNLILNYKD